MQRDKRVRDNWAFVYAQELSRIHAVPLRILYTRPTISPKFTNTRRRVSFEFEGLKLVEKELLSLKIPFYALLGDAKDVVVKFIRSHPTSHLVCDYTPLKEYKADKADLVHELARTSLDCNITQVDAFNIVPVWIASDKKEYMARTIRPKIEKHLSEFLVEFPEVKSQKESLLPEDDRRHLKTGVDWNKILTDLSREIDESVMPVNWLHPGPDGGLKALNEFVKTLKPYADLRNIPSADATSNLSPYINMGFLSAQRIALTIKNAKGPSDAKDSYLEELIIRRELSENFCEHEPRYDSFDAIPDWARNSLEEHAGDRRDHLYSREDFEAAKTYDSLWNAAQKQLIFRGKIHGYMRMYWAKKILEWSKTPHEALETAFYLNDKYAIDGIAPNGFVGCLWSIGGVHDRGWTERTIFGKVRYMNRAGCERKFDVPAYIQTVAAIETAAKK